MSRVILTSGRLFGGSGEHPFSAIAADIEPKVDAIMLSGAQKVRAAAKNEVQNTAYDTGRLLHSIMVKRVKSMMYYIVTAVPYAGYVHDGTWKMPARPFFQWAFDTAGWDVLVELQELFGGTW